MKCDFCDKQEMPVACHWSETFMLHDFTAQMPGFDDKWAACGTCHDLIVTEERWELLERAHDTEWLKIVPPEMHDLVKGEVSQVHLNFWKGYAGRWEVISNVQ